MLRLISVALIFSMASSAWAERPKHQEAEKSADGPDKVLCKRFAETGSLIASKRICKTKADWDRDREALRRNMTGGGSCNVSGAPGGNC